VIVRPEDEAPRRRSGDGFSEAVTVAFGDERADVYGVARLGLADGGASGLAIVFHRGEPVAVRAEDGVAVDAPRAWDDVSVAGIGTEVVEPLGAWRLHYASDEASLDLDLRAAGGIAALDPEHPAARAGGLSGYEQPVRVTGSANVGGRRVGIDGLGQRGHSWGAPDWDRIALARTVGAWLEGEVALSLTAIRPAGAKHHDDERLVATILERDPKSGEALAIPVVEPRLSTAYDGDGRQRAAGLELFVDPDGMPRRAAGEVVCGTTLDLGRLTLHCAFFRWRMEGRAGVGRYDVLARSA
jgi:hypothetical protein